jgi:hypothetical protein
MGAIGALIAPVSAVQPEGRALLHNEALMGIGGHNSGSRSATQANGTGVPTHREGGCAQLPAVQSARASRRSSVQW